MRGWWVGRQHASALVGGGLACHRALGVRVLRRLSAHRETQRVEPCAALSADNDDWQALGFNLDEAQQNRTFLRREKTERGDTSAWTDTPADKARRQVMPFLSAAICAAVPPALVPGRT